MAAAVARDLAKVGIVVVSGLARGIDAAAHRAALEVGGMTVAVLGTPIDRTYPADHKSLQEEIAQRGALVSQFPPGLPISRFNFPERNRVMAGICLATVVVEAGDTSGAVIQARQCLSQGRTLFLTDLVRKNTAHRWAASYLARGALVANNAAAILKHLDEQWVFLRLLSPQISVLCLDGLIDLGDLSPGMRATIQSITSLGDVVAVSYRNRREADEWLALNLLGIKLIDVICKPGAWAPPPISEALAARDRKSWEAVAICTDALEIAQAHTVGAGSILLTDRPEGPVPHGPPSRPGPTSSSEPEKTPRASSAPPTSTQVTWARFSLQKALSHGLVP